MTQHTYLTCDACNAGCIGSDQSDYTTIMAAVPFAEEKSPSYGICLHFCKNCFGSYAREMHRVAVCKGFIVLEKT